jgi:hypothetical protein
MKTFLHTIFEKEIIKSDIAKILAKYSYEVSDKKSTSKKLVLIVKSNDRTGTSAQIKKELSNNGITFTEEKISSLSGSTPVLVIQGNTSVQTIIVFKPASGGMNETTLNSTITELSPAIAFSMRYHPKSVDDFYSFLMTVNQDSLDVYVNANDKKAGAKFISEFSQSSKFKEKMNNAMGVLKYLYDEDKKSKIKRVIWGYRAKPFGIPSSHKGDIFIEYQTGGVIGVSLKAGTETSSEPKLNTYVNPILTSFGISNNKLRTLLYTGVYSKIPNIGSATVYDTTDKRNTLKILEILESTAPDKYNSLYDTGLDIIRNYLIDMFNTNHQKTINWIKSAILGENDGTPLVVVKAFNDKYTILTDDDNISMFLPKVKDISVTKSTSSKQDFFIELIAGQEKLKMKFAVRTNKTGVEHKLGQFFNLSVKFNGIK